MSATRPGRPLTADEPLDAVVRFSLTNAERNRLDAAIPPGETRSGWIRRAILTRLEETR